MVEYLRPLTDGMVSKLEGESCRICHKGFKKGQFVITVTHHNDVSMSRSEHVHRSCYEDLFF